MRTLLTKMTGFLSANYGSVAAEEPVEEAVSAADGRYPLHGIIARGDFVALMYYISQIYRDKAALKEAVNRLDDKGTTPLGLAHSVIQRIRASKPITADGQAMLYQQDACILTLVACQVEPIVQANVDPKSASFGITRFGPDAYEMYLIMYRRLLVGNFFSLGDDRKLIPDEFAAQWLYIATHIAVTDPTISQFSVHFVEALKMRSKYVETTALIARGLFDCEGLSWPSIARWYLLCWAFDEDIDNIRFNKKGHHVVYDYFRISSVRQSDYYTRWQQALRQALGFPDCKPMATHPAVECFLSASSPKKKKAKKKKKRAAEEQSSGTVTPPVTPAVSVTPVALVTPATAEQSFAEQSDSSDAESVVEPVMVILPGRVVYITEFLLNALVDELENCTSAHQGGSKELILNEFYIFLAVLTHMAVPHRFFSECYSKLSLLVPAAWRKDDDCCYESQVEATEVVALWNRALIFVLQNVNRPKSKSSWVTRYLELLKGYFVLPLQEVAILADLRVILESSLMVQCPKVTIDLVGSLVSAMVTAVVTGNLLQQDHDDIDLALSLNISVEQAADQAVVTKFLDFLRVSDCFTLGSVYDASTQLGQHLATLRVTYRAAVKVDLALYSERQPLDSRKDSFKSFAVDLATGRLSTDIASLLRVVKRKRTFDATQLADEKYLAYVFREIARDSVLELVPQFKSKYDAFLAAPENSAVIARAVALMLTKYTRTIESSYFRYYQSERLWRFIPCLVECHQDALAVAFMEKYICFLERSEVFSGISSGQNLFPTAYLMACFLYLHRKDFSVLLQQPFDRLPFPRSVITELRRALAAFKDLFVAKIPSASGLVKFTVDFILQCPEFDEGKRSFLLQQSVFSKPGGLVANVGAAEFTLSAPGP